MPLIYLVRHGRAAGSWDAERDPGLDGQGRGQADAMSQALAPKGPLELRVSPMARALQTAEPLATRWGVTAALEPRVSEIPSPVEDLSARGLWLREIAGGTWRGLDAAGRHWHQGIVDVLMAVKTDTVFVTHFMVINIAHGAATGSDRMVGFRPDYCSVTVLRLESEELSLVQLGQEAATRVL